MNAQNVGINGPNRYLTILQEAWEAHLTPRNEDAPTVISLFAGCGGSSLGYSMAGYRELLAVEWDKNACETFRLNFPDIPLWSGDITNLSDNEALNLAGIQSGLLDILDGSPPCQGFSMAGKRKIDDSRNRLFEQYIRLLQAFQPKVFVMENVSGMVKGKMKLVFVECLKALKECGYQVSAKLMNAMWFNVPQSRERMIFIGVREDLGIKPSHPKAENRMIGLREAIGLRRGWGRRNEGIKNKQFHNNFRSLDLPSVTLEKTRPPIIIINEKERELSLDECTIIGSFPLGFKWGMKAYQGIGNSVPPLFMRSIANYIRSEILNKIPTAALQFHSKGIS